MASLNSAFLVAYGLMYLGGGRLMDVVGTRLGFALIMVFWSLACASHGLANGVMMLVISRLLLGIGEGGGFPAATRAVAEWFPVGERSTAMGIMNAGTAVGGIMAPPLIAAVLMYADWLELAPWRWVFYLTGAMGLLWTLWWCWEYFAPEKHPRLGVAEREEIRSVLESDEIPKPGIPLVQLLRFRETWGLVTAKFLSDAAWYFYLFWLPRYLYDARGFDIKAVGSVAWIPHAAAGIGCLCGGGLSTWLLARQYPLNRARKLALGASAAMMPTLGVRTSCVCDLGDCSLLRWLLWTAILVNSRDDSPNRSFPQASCRDCGRAGRTGRRHGRDRIRTACRLPSRSRGRLRADFRARQHLSRPGLRIDSADGPNCASS